MTLIAGVGDEVTHFFAGFFLVLIVAAAWWTTNIEQRPVRTVFLLERRRHRTHRRLTNHTEAVTITEGTSNLTSISEEVSPESSTSHNNGNPENQQQTSGMSNTTGERRSSQEAQNIIDSMDNETSLLRQRRVAFYNNWNYESDISQAETSSESQTNLTTPVNPEKVRDDVIMEHNYADCPGTSSSNIIKENNSVIEDQNQDIHENEGITIKLKYINDDLKLVTGKLEEQIGDFRRRHFQEELSANKLVRLIFNGQVLQPDTQTLASCGLFNNCVVHCLIHQKRTPNTESTVPESRQEGYSFPTPNGIQNMNNNRDWDFGNFLFALISFILLAAWYFRYVYAHLYTVTATVGLFLITGIFTIVLVGMYFPDNDPMPPPTIRFAPERPHPQQ